MAYAKLSLLPLFLLATLLLMFSMKKVEAYTCVGWPCSREEPSCGGGCHCLFAKVGPGSCARDKHVAKMVKEHPDLCESHADCTRKASGSFCAYYPNSSLKYGWCFDSNSEAEASFKNALSSEFSNLVKMPLDAST
ncbi:albumin-1-like [Vicia villosa]|uniref:albumin-1-like n=1 Tax=Vicia villosa TaxID=3911 RepID=UPI00273BC0F3|nr:albumin-1-like [Vicia villosa]